MKTVLSSCKSVPEALTHLLDCMAPAIQAYFEYLKNQDNEKARLIANFDTSYGHDGFFNTFYNYPTSPLSENHTSDSGLDIKEEKEGVLVIEVEDDMVMTYKARPPATKSKKRAEIDTVILVSDEDSLPSSSSGISVCTAMTTESCDNRAPSTLTLSTLSTSPALSETSSINGPTFEDNTSLQSPPSLHSPDKEHNNFSGEIVTDCTLTDQTNKIFPEENNGFSKALTANLPTSKVETSPLFGIIAPCQDVERTQSISENTMLSMLNLKLDEDNNSQSTSNQNSEIPLAIDAASLFDSRQTETPTDTSDETNMDSMAILENSQKECDVPSRQESEMAFDISANPITESNTTCVSKNEVSVTLPKSCASPISLMPSSTLQNFMSDAKASTSYTLSAITDTVSESTQNRYGEKSTFTSASLAVESSYPELNTNLPDDVETTSQDTLPSTDTISSSFNGSIAHSICMFKNPTFGEELTTISIKPISTMSHLTSINSSTCTDEPKIESAAMSQCGEDLINISAMPLLKTQKQSNTLVPNSKVRQAKTKSNTIRKLGVITPSTRSDENPLHLKDFGKHPKERSVPERECSFNNYLTTCGNKYFSSEESSINNGLYSENSTIYSDMDTQLSEEGGAIDFDNYTDPEQDNVTSISEVDVKETIVLPPPATLDFNGHNDEDQYYYYKSNTEICTECDECQIEKEYSTFNNSRTTFTDISKKKSANSKKRDRIKRKSRNKKRSEREYPNRLNKGEKYKPQKVLYTSDAMVDYLKTDMNVDKEFDGVMSGPVSDRNFPFCSSFDSAPEETSDTESPAYNKIDPTDLKNYMRDEFIFDKNHDVISDSKSIPKKSSVTFSDVVDTRYISSNNSKSKDKKQNGDYIIRDGIKCYVDPTDRKLNEELQLVVRKLTPSDIANILLDLANKSMTGNHNTMKTCIRKKIDCSLTENYAAATMNDIRIKGMLEYDSEHDKVLSGNIPHPINNETPTAQDIPPSNFKPSDSLKCSIKINTKASGLSFINGIIKSKRKRKKMVSSYDKRDHKNKTNRTTTTTTTTDIPLFNSLAFSPKFDTRENTEERIVTNSSNDYSLTNGSVNSEQESKVIKAVNSYDDIPDLIDNKILNKTPTVDIPLSNSEFVTSPKYPPKFNIKEKTEMDILTDSTNDHMLTSRVIDSKQENENEEIVNAYDDMPGPIDNGTPSADIPLSKYEFSGSPKFSAQFNTKRNTAVRIVIDSPNDHLITNGVIGSEQDEEVEAVNSYEDTSSLINNETPTAYIPSSKTVFSTSPQFSPKFNSKENIQVRILIDSSVDHLFTNRGIDSEEGNDHIEVVNSYDDTRGHMTDVTPTVNIPTSNTEFSNSPKFSSKFNTKENTEVCILRNSSNDHLFSNGVIDSEEENYDIEVVDSYEDTPGFINKGTPTAHIPSSNTEFYNSPKFSPKFNTKENTEVRIVTDSSNDHLFTNGVVDSVQEHEDIEVVNSYDDMPGLINNGTHSANILPSNSQKFSPKFNTNGIIDSEQENEHVEVVKLDDSIPDLISNRIPAVDIPLSNSEFSNSPRFSPKFNTKQNIEVSIATDSSNNHLFTNEVIDSEQENEEIEVVNLDGSMPGILNNSIPIVNIPLSASEFSNSPKFSPKFNTKANTEVHVVPDSSNGHPFTNGGFNSGEERENLEVVNAIDDILSCVNKTPTAQDILHSNSELFYLSKFPSDTEQLQHSVNKALQNKNYIVGDMYPDRRTLLANNSDFYCSKLVTEHDNNAQLLTEEDSVSAYVHKENIETHIVTDSSNDISFTNRETNSELENLNHLIDLNLYKPNDYKEEHDHKSIYFKEPILNSLPFSENIQNDCLNSNILSGSKLDPCSVINENDTVTYLTGDVAWSGTLTENQLNILLKQYPNLEYNIVTPLGFETESNVQTATELVTHGHCEDVQLPPTPINHNTHSNVQFLSKMNKLCERGMENKPINKVSRKRNSAYPNTGDSNSLQTKAEDVEVEGETTPKKNLEGYCVPITNKDLRKLLQTLREATGTERSELYCGQETKLPLKKRRFNFTNEESPVSNNKEPSYPSCRMLSIADITCSTSFRTAAERKEMPPLALDYTERNPETNPIVNDEPNTFHNSTINYQMIQVYSCDPSHPSISLLTTPFGSHLPNESTFPYGSSSYGDLHENIHSTYIQGHRIIVDGYIPPHRRRGRPRKRPMEEEYTSRKKRR
ncbi:hypothetical protein Trydic_g16827 [Trypoxylus dichotomus]